MTVKTGSLKSLRQENDELKARLKEAEELLRAAGDGNGESRASGNGYPAPETAGARSNLFTDGFLAQINEAVIATDNERRVIFFNDAAAAQYGVGTEDALNKTLDEIFRIRWNHPEDEARSEKALSENGRWLGENTHIRTDGSEFYAESSISLRQNDDGKADGLILIVRDITDRELTEYEFRKRDERYRAFIEQSTEGIWRFELEQPIPIDLSPKQQIELVYQYGYLAECNTAMARQYGHERAEDLAGSRMADLYVDNDPKNDRILREFIESGYRITDAETHEKDLDGNDKYFLNNFVGIVEDGKLVRGWGTQRDITAAKISQNATAHLAAIVESSDDAIISKDLDGKILSWNVGAERIFGYTAEEAIGRSITMLIPPARLNEEAEILGRIRAGEPVDHFDTRRIRKDGREIDVSITVSPIRNDRDEIIGASKIARDITEQKLASEMSERYHLLSMQARDIIIFLDAETGQIVEANPAAIAAYGYDHATLLKKHIRDLRAPESLSILDQQYQTADEQGIQFETIHQRADGTKFPVEVSAIGSDIGGERMIISIIRDITDRRVAEETLRQNQAILAIAMQSSQMGTLECDIASGTVSWSEELESIFGLEKGEFRGDDDHFLELVHEEDRERVWSEIQNAVAQQRPYNTEFRFRHKDGSIRWMEGRGEAVYSQKGEPVRIYGAGIDITDRKRAEQALQESDERFRLALSSGAVTVYEQDLDLRYKWVYPDVLYAPDIIGKREPELDGDDARLRSELKRRVIETGESIREEVPAAVMGTTHWYDLLIEPRRDAAGNIIGVGGTALDITERRKLEESLLGSEERFRGLIEQAPFSVQLLDTSGRTTSVNKAWEELWGATIEQIDGYNILEDPQLEAAGIAQILRRAFAGEAVDLPVIEYDPDLTVPGVSSHDDSRRWISAVAYPLKGPDGTIREVALVHQDITARKRAELHVEHQNRILEAVAIGESLEEILDETTLTLEQQIAGSMASVLLASDDGARLHCASAKSLPAEYNAAIDGLPVGEGVGCCGTAAYRQSAVIVADIAKDPLWESYRDLAAKHGLAACWSVPIISPDGNLRGTFAIYFSEPRKPQNEELRTLQSAARVAGIAIERKLAEERLRHSEERYRSLANAMPQLVWTADSGGIVDYYNSLASNYEGIVFDRELEKWDWSLTVHPDDLPATEAAWRNALSNDYYEIEHRIKMKDGTYRWHLSRAHVVSNPESSSRRRWFGTATDIHEHKMAQEALVEAERKAADEYFAMLSRIVPVAQALGTARDLNTVYRAVRDFVRNSMPCSAFFVSFFDAGTRLRTAAYVWGEQGELDISSLPPMELTEDGGPNSQAVYGRRSVIVNRYMDEMAKRPHLVIQEDGIDPNSSLAVPMIVMGRVTGTIEVQAYEHDAFDQEHVIALEMVANLAAVAIENVRLLEIEARARIDAEAANRMKDEFLSILSHELRTPLNAMLGWVRMLRAGILDEERSSKALEVIERNTRQQSSLIEDLLDVSRIISGKMRIEKELVDLRAVVKDVSESMRPLALSKGLQYHVRLNEDALFMNGDSMRLQQVITNLVQNAVKFTASGGTIDVEIRSGGDNASIVVRDTGVGIDSEFLPNIFDRFTQADASTRRTYAGLGLGLTIVSTIVDLHGGKINVESEGLNKGAEFTVTLPLAEEFYKKGEPAPASPETRGTKLDGVRVLLVDDDTESLIPLQIFLERQGASVTCEGGAADALSRLAAEDFDVLVSDIGMPEIDGYQLARQMRMMHGRNSAVAAIAVTAFAAPEHRVQALAAGFDAHISKPMDFEELLTAIRSTHEQKR